MLRNAQIPIIGFAAYSGTGKTTLLVALLPLLSARGLRVGVLKHAHHEFDIDKPGKDSFELRAAGAQQMLVTSRKRWALIVERELDDEPSLDDALLGLNQNSLDLILVEGFKRVAFPKIELHRGALRRPLLCRADANIIAVASDGDPGADVSLPLLDLNEPRSVADFIANIVVGAAHAPPGR